jgi:hypothetical protein
LSVPNVFPGFANLVLDFANFLVAFAKVSPGLANRTRIPHTRRRLSGGLGPDAHGLPWPDGPRRRDIAACRHHKRGAVGGKSTVWGRKSAEKAAMVPPGVSSGLFLSFYDMRIIVLR